jgi:acetylornithine aminotransferase
MVAAITTLEVIEKDGLLEHAARMGEIVKSGLARELAGVAGVKDVRGMGLMLGVELDRPCSEIVKRALAAGLVSNVTADKVIRILPPLILDESQARQLVDLLVPVIKGFLAQAPAAAAA